MRILAVQVVHEAAVVVEEAVDVVEPCHWRKVDLSSGERVDDVEVRGLVGGDELAVA